MPSDPAPDFDGAQRRMRALAALDTSRVKPTCRSRLLDHGRQTDQAIVLFHGFTNCPAQFSQLAVALFDHGYNVLVPRMPRHGLEPLADDLGLLSPEDLVETIRRSLDIAHGLGKRVTALGFSMGGGLSAWCAQNRSDIDRVIMISPNIGINSVPRWAMRPASNLFSMLPNFFRWWDPDLKDARIGPPHVYPRYASRGIGTMLRMNVGTLHQSMKSPPAVRQIDVITNPADEVVSNAVTGELVDNWRRHGARVSTYELPTEWRLIHDLMDPTQIDQQVDRVYPYLMDKIIQN
jgi:pimeloyl-ACP methyl ester carboxylesterase